MSRRDQQWPEWRARPCGTRAAYRRHLRRSERPCPACLEAERVAQPGTPSARPDRPREIRNGLPEHRPYVYRGRGYDIYEEADCG